MEPPFDRSELQGIYEGDTDLFVELMEMVNRRIFNDLEEVRTLILREESRELRQKAHQTRSMLVSIAAVPAASAAEHLEAAARNRRDSEYGMLFSSLVFEIRKLVAYYKEGKWRSLF